MQVDFQNVFVMQSPSYDVQIPAGVDTEQYLHQRFVFPMSRLVLAVC